ncbi:MAG: type II toxin-antitoxin system Phd/YefM family antitoxin [Candidatus Sumerlaeota bacterium]|nr:type II toxin-antitoxin system Phd/YefM family antitoxin [Candidatus Sumerlaeota bacterium]
MITLSTGALKRCFSEAISRAAYAKERVLLTRRGKSLAAIVSVEDLETLEALDEKADALDAKRILKAYRTGKERAISLEEAAQELGNSLAQGGFL